MRKEEIMGMTIAGLTTLIMVWLTRWDAYVDAMGNWLMIILLVFAISTIIGLGVTGLFYGRGGKSNEKTVDDFTGSD